MFIRSGYSAQMRSLCSATEHHHNGSDELVGGLDQPPLERSEAERRRLGLELRGLEPVEPDDVAAARAPAVAVDHLAHPMDRDPLALVLDGHRLGEVDDPVVLVHVGQRRRRRALVESLERVSERQREQPARLHMRSRAAQERSTSVMSAEQLHGLHRRQHDREAAAQRELARVGADGLDRKAGGASAKRLEQNRIAVQPDDGHAKRGEVERHAAGAATEVEHRAGARELAPEGQVLGVAAAFEVVPDHVHHQANDPFAAPRSTSSSRSASIAVYVGSAYSGPSPSAIAASSPPARLSRTTIRSSGTPAYFMRTAISAARVPLQVTRRTRSAITSKSASQTQLTSRPSATLSFSTAKTSCSPGSRVSVRSTSLAPAGFFTSRIDRSRPRRRTSSARPKAGETPCRPATTSSSGAQRKP